MPRDHRNFLVIDEGMVNNPKIAPRSDKAFRTYIELLSWSATQLTDGSIPPDIFKRFGTQRARQELINAGLVEVEHSDETGRDISRYLIHDYLEHQRSREDVLRVRKARSEAGSRGGKATARKAMREQQMVQQNSSNGGSKRAAEEEEEREGDRTTDVVLQRRGRDESLNASFEDAWSHWPKKAEAMKARAAYVTLAIRHGVDFLHDEVVRHGDAWAEHEETKFCPRLAEWLRDERWQEKPPGSSVQKSGQQRAQQRQAELQNTLDIGRRLQEEHDQRIAEQHAIEGGFGNLGRNM